MSWGDVHIGKPGSAMLCKEGTEVQGDFRKLLLSQSVGWSGEEGFELGGCREIRGGKLRPRSTLKSSLVVGNESNTEH